MLWEREFRGCQEIEEGEVGHAGIEAADGMVVRHGVERLDKNVADDEGGDEYGFRKKLVHGYMY